MQGKSATSNEFYVAKALDKLLFEYYFQVAFLGGRQMSGGLVLDFLVETVPLPTPLLVNGEYWHRDPTKEFLQLAILASYEGFAPPVIVWGEETDSEEQAYATIRRAFT